MFTDDKMGSMSHLFVIRLKFWMQVTILGKERARVSPHMS